MRKMLYKIIDSNFFHKNFDGLRWYEGMLYKLKTINKAKGEYRHG